MLLFALANHYGYLYEVMPIQSVDIALPAHSTGLSDPYLAEASVRGVFLSAIHVRMPPS
jgi:hypothetical protein